MKVVVNEDVCRLTHPGFESDEFENHFHSEDSSEDHIKNVHYIVEERWLSVVLQRGDEETVKENWRKGSCYYFDMHLIYFRQNKDSGQKDTKQTRKLYDKNAK